MYTALSTLLLAGLAAAAPNAGVPDPQFSANTLHLDSIIRPKHNVSLERRSSPSKLFETDADNQFQTTIKFGGQSFKAVIDTGSSDTWLVGSGFQCVDTQGNPIALAQCGFAGLYQFQSDTSLKQTANEENENFLVSYGSGEYLTGLVANDKITLGGLSFTTEIGIAQAGYWNGDGSGSGLIGLAFPELTSAYLSPDVSGDSPANRRPYSPILSTLFNGQHYKPAMFSIALSRDLSASGYGGALTIGGVPNLSDPRINAKPKWTYTKLVTTPLLTNQVLTFYTIMVQSVSWGSGSKAGHDSTATRWAVDSGTSLIYAPANIAKAYNALWSQKATLHPKAGVWTVPCSATAPPFSVKIGGTTFNVNAKDLLGPYSADGTVCLSSIVEKGPDSPPLLGDVFLKNVVAIFDWGNKRMGFTARTTYQS